MKKKMEENPNMEDYMYLDVIDNAYLKKIEEKADPVFVNKIK